MTWNVTYEFQRREPDWTAFVIARDPVTGEPVVLTDVNRGRSSKTVVLYGEAEFHQLRLYTA